jgi:CRISPR/Cas system-associated exonuclease Cas4 (RecB family)
MTLYNYLDEMWSVLITNDLRDVLLDTLSIVQERKHELEEILEEIEETLENQELSEE